MPRKRRRRPAATTAQPAFRTTAGWQWRSFPVFFAFACGAFLMGVLNGVTNPVGLVFFYATLFGVAFGAAHMVTRWLAERRLRRQAPSREPQQDSTERPRATEGSHRR